MGQIIDAKVQITAYHKGYIFFKLCANNNVNQDPDQSCFNATPLKFADGSERFVLPFSTPYTYNLKLKLPDGLSCSQCIIQVC